MRYSFELLGVIFLQAACSSRHVPTPLGTDRVAGPSTDRAILAKLLVHQQAASQILNLCAQRASRDQLKQDCSTGAASVRSKTDQLEAWLGKAKDDRSNQRHDDQYKTLFDQMRSASGDAFDEAAARAIRVHAREGVTESTQCEQAVTTPAVKAFCSDLNTNQQRTVENATRWICEWFRDCTESGRSR